MRHPDSEACVQEVIDGYPASTPVAEKLCRLVRSVCGEMEVSTPPAAPDAEADA